MSREDDATAILAEWLARGEVLGGADKRLIKRAYPRFDAPEDYTLKPVQEGDFPERFAKGFNISAGGLGVISRHAIHGGVPVLVHSESSKDDDPWISACVAHCTRTLGGYKIGLRFEF